MSEVHPETVDGLRCRRCKGPVHAVEGGGFACVLCGVAEVFDPTTLGYEKCPPCKGTGGLVQGEYLPDAPEGRAPYAPARLCRRCNGSGLVPAEKRDAEG